MNTKGGIYLERTLDMSTPSLSPSRRIVRRPLVHNVVKVAERYKAVYVCVCVCVCVCKIQESAL